MATDYTTTGLLTRIRQYAYIGSGHPAYTDAVLLRMADECLSDDVLMALHSRNSDYGVAVEDQAITAGVQDYPIPSRALWGIVRDVSVLDAAGAFVQKLPWLDLEDLDTYAGSTSVGGAYDGVVVVDDVLRVVPTPASTTGTLRIRYYRRPGALTAVSTGSDESPHAITANPTSTTVTIGTHAFDSGDYVDFIQANPPFATLAQRVALTGVAATTITIATGVDDAAVGDYVCASGESPVPQVTAELHTVLARGVAAQVLAESGSAERHAVALAAYDSALTRAVSMLAPRNLAGPARLVNRTSGLGRR